MTIRQNVENSDDGKAVGRRVREVFGNATNAEIARQIDVSEAAAQTYTTTRIPPYDVLLKIAETTKCNLHWLLTGEGSRSVIPVEGSAIAKRLESIANEQVIPLFGEVDIAGTNAEQRALKLLTEFLLSRALERYGLLDGELLAPADRKLAKKFSFVQDAPKTLEEQIRDMIATSSPGKTVSQVAQKDEFRDMIRELVQEEIAIARRAPLINIDFGHADEGDEENVPRRKAS